MRVFSVYDPILSNDELEIVTPSDLHKILYSVIQSVDKNIEPKSSPIIYIGNIEYNVVYMSLSNTDEGILTDLSILYRIITKSSNQIEAWYRGVDIVEFIFIESPNIYEGAGSILTTWSIDLEEDIVETEQEIKKRKKKESIIFGDSLQEFTPKQKDVFFNETLPKHLILTLSKYKYKKH